MSLDHPDRRRGLPVRLCDVRADELARAARLAAQAEPDPEVRAQILHAAVCPSDRVFWVAESARPMLDRIAA